VHPGARTKDTRAFGSRRCRQLLGSARAPVIARGLLRAECSPATGAYRIAIEQAQWSGRMRPPEHGVLPSMPMTERLSWT